MRTKRRYAHELYPHAGEYEVRATQRHERAVLIAAWREGLA